MTKEVEVTTFESPHKFWFIYKEDEEKRNKLQTLINRQISLNPVEVKPSHLLTCIAFHKSSFKRAVIHKFNSNNVFTVWLIDYGITVDVTKIFKISNDLLQLNCYVKQASLLNVVPATSRLHCESFTISSEHVDQFTPGTIKTIQDHIKWAKKIEFVNDYVHKEIYCGEIILHKNDDKYSLIPLLIEMKHIMIDKDDFKKALNQMVLKSPKYFLEEILKVSDFEDENSQSLGSAISRHKAPISPNVQHHDKKEEAVTPIIDSDSTSSCHLDTSSITSLSTENDINRAISVTSSSASDSDIWDNVTQMKTRKIIKLRPPELSQNRKTKLLKNTIKCKTESVNCKEEPKSINKFTSEKNLSFRSVSNNNSNCEVKIGCHCNNCLTWRTNDLTGQKLEFVDVIKKECREIEKPPLLFKNENEENKTAIKAKKFASISKSQRLITPTLLVHGYTIPSPIQLVAKAPFNLKVHQILRNLNYEKPKPVQTYSWPAIMRHLNVCIINAGRTGKTMCYIPAISSYILEKNERYPNLPAENGPIAIIVSSNCDIAENIYTMTHEIFLKMNRNIKVGYALPPLDRYTLKQFEIPCDILISTPLSLLSLLSARVINMKRLCHLIFENIDLLLNKLSNEIQTLLNGVQNMLEHRNVNYSVQLIFTSESWTVKMEKLLSKLESLPFVCIGQHLEAALYGKLDLQMHFVTSVNKKNSLNDILRDKTNYYKTLIVCENEEEIDEIERYLIAEGKSMVILKKSLPLHIIHEYELVWEKSTNDIIFICTDDILNCYVNITDAGLLIHYSLPKDSWSTFCKRFKSLIDNYTSPFANNDSALRNKVHIFVDETCDKQFPRLQNFLNKIGANFPTIFKDYCEKIEHNTENDKIKENIKLCNNIKIFGNCQVFQCPKRHYLNETLDANNTIPDSGTVHFRISHILDATIFAAHLIEHIDLKTGVCEKISNQTKEIETKLSEMFKNDKSYPDVIELHKLYVWEENINQYKRCQIVSIVQVETLTKQPNKVKIELIDHGKTEIISTAQLYEMSEKFKSIPRQTVIIHLSNFIPPEKDLKWRKNLRHIMKKLFEKENYEDEDTYFSSKILLKLGVNLWVKDVQLKETLHVTKVTITKLSLRNILLKRNYGIPTDEPLKKLYSLCQNFKITLPDYEIVKVTETEFKQVEPQWAYLEDKEYNEVYFSSAYSIDKLYIRVKKFDTIFKKFQDELQTNIRKPFYRTEFPIEVGKYYLAKDPEGNEYGRIKVISIEENDVECFFVDYGDSICYKQTELKYLSDEYITKLPFQAIECKLYGLEEISNDFRENILDILYQYSLEPDTDYYRTLYMKIMNFTSVDKRNLYSIVLFDHFNEKIININKLIVECGWALSNEHNLFDIHINIPKEIVTSEKDGSFDDDDDTANSLQSIEDIDHDDDWDMMNPEDFLKEIFGPTTQQTNHVNIKSKNNNNNNLKAITEEAVPTTSYYNPDVVWYQSDKHVKMEIHLSDVRDYTLKLLRGNLFHFKTICNSKEYQINITLYKPVEKTFQHTVYGQLIRIIMTKVNKEEEWPILTTQKMRNIKYDVEKGSKPDVKSKPMLTIDVDVSDNEEDLLYEIGSDVDYSESDIDVDSDEN